MLKEALHFIIHFMKENAAWAGFITFWIALLESLPVFGYLLPGSVLLTGIGLLIGAKIIPLVDITLWAIAGAIVGDGFSYLLGHHYHENIRNLKIFSRFLKWLDEGEQFFTRHGGKSVFLGRFFGPLRPIVPVIAGMMNMPAKVFLFANISSAILWAPIHLLPGIILARLSLTFTPHKIGHFIAGFLLILVIVWLCGLLLRVIILNFIYLINRITRPLWAKLKTKTFWPRLAYIFYASPEVEKDHYQLSILLGALVFFILFSIYSISEVHHGIVTFYNSDVQEFFTRWQQPWLTSVAKVITLIGDKRVIVALTLSLGSYCVYKKAWNALFCLFLAFCSTVAIVYGLKTIFHVQRPEIPGLALNFSSYPSGHTTLSTVIYSMMIILVRSHMKPDSRWFLYHIMIVTLIVVFISRLYLSAHWLSDIVGSLLLVGGLVLTHLFILRRQAIQKISSIPFLSIAFATVVIGVGLLSWHGLAKVTVGGFR